jgi:hypothetical protein
MGFENYVLEKVTGCKGQNMMEIEDFHHRITLIVSSEYSVTDWTGGLEKYRILIRNCLWNRSLRRQKKYGSEHTKVSLEEKDMK